VLVDEFDVVFAFVADDADADFVVLVDVDFIVVLIVVHDHAFVVGNAAFL
jgi:hypothetical protein